jgi:hypothetical protein
MHGVRFLCNPPILWSVGDVGASICLENRAWVEISEQFDSVTLFQVSFMPGSL